MSATSNIERQVVVVTGGNQGLGLEIIRSLVKSKDHAYRIFMGSRSIDKAKTAIQSLNEDISNSKSVVEPVQVDVSKDESIEAAFAYVQSAASHVDVLINNAGVNTENEAKQGQKTLREVYTEMYDVNVTGTQIFTHNFAPLLIKSNNPRLIFITSGTSSIQEASEGKPPTAPFFKPGWPKDDKWPLTGYRVVKSALNMLMSEQLWLPGQKIQLKKCISVEWHRMLRDDGVKVFAISPGFLATNLAGAGAEKLKSMGALDPSVGADFVRAVVEGERDADVAKVIRNHHMPTIQGHQVPLIQPF